MDDRAFPECLTSPASNHTKLVCQGDNPNKKTLMYILYVLCGYRLNVHSLCYLGMSISCKHIQRLCSDNTWMIVPSQNA